MILRLLRGEIVGSATSRLLEFVRDQAIHRALSIPGLLSFQPAVREGPAGLEVVIVTTWSGFDELTAAGSDLDTPVSVLTGAELLTDTRAEHYELVIGEARTLPLRAGKLRLARIRIRPNAESAYYAAVRAWAERLLDDAGMVAFTLGRRVVGRQDEVLAAQLWQDESALRSAAGRELERPMGARELSEFWAAEPEIEHFDALTAVDPRPDAPAILLADDRRRYVHATPAASKLSGQPLARLLTMHVEDVTPPAERTLAREAWERFVTTGSVESGRYRLARPDGTEVDVRFAAKANAPWPGSHASLLVPVGGAAAGGGSTAGRALAGRGDPADSEDRDDRGVDDLGDGDDPADLDVDRALVEAGLVARYSPA